MAALQYAHVEPVSHPRAPRAGDRSSRPLRFRSRRREGLAPERAVLAVVALLLLGPAVAGAVGEGLARPGADAPAPPALAHGASPLVPGDVHVVQPGETYWSIARVLAGDDGDDVRPLVEELLAANGTGVLQAGDRLVLPKAGSKERE